MITEEKNIKEVGFTVDAGLIQRLGYELVGRAETAVSELIKNAYDADAIIVDVEFIDSDHVGGTLIISDNGVGMTEDNLINKFMRISSADKIHNPISDRFKRRRAGRKGIGRFATQRLGTKLSIVTQTVNSSYATKIVIEWNKYLIDSELSSIKFPIGYKEKERAEGTTLIIEGLTDRWSDTSIKRVYRYVLDLLQPEYLAPPNLQEFSSHQLENQPNSQKHQKFKVRFKKTVGGNTDIIIGKDDDIIDKSLVSIEGYIENNQCYYSIISHKFINDINDKEKYTIPEDLIGLKGVHFKVYYIIYDPLYNKDVITQIDLNDTSKLAKKEGGVKLYRNGFKVLPYGEEGNDWLNLDKGYTGKSGQTSIPWSNKNFFGFVQITDTEGTLFEETASREGLIENTSFANAIEFVKQILEIARKRISAEVFKIRENEKKEIPFDNKIDTLQNKIFKQLSNLETLVSESERGQVNDLKLQVTESFIILKQKTEDLLTEVSLLRVLAGMGLTIGVFAHEMRGLIGSVRGIMSPIYNNIKDNETRLLLEELDKSITNLVKYSATFEKIIAQNTQRELKPINIANLIVDFSESIVRDSTKRGITIKTQQYGDSLLTLPMHESEWYTILLNLYTNARKAIKRACQEGHIYIVVGQYEDKIYLEFMDNGDGIKDEFKDRVFDAFFTTSIPLISEMRDDSSGSGLGLKIVKDIVHAYKGSIFLDNPESGYNTCFRIEVNKISIKQREEYGY